MSCLREDSCIIVSSSALDLQLGVYDENLASRSYVNGKEDKEDLMNSLKGSWGSLNSQTTL